MPSYWRVSPKLWTEDFGSVDARTLMLYLLTCQHRSAEGLFRLPRSYVTADLGWTPKRFVAALTELIKGGYVDYDDQHQVCLILKALKYQAPQNPNQVTYAVRALNDLPPSRLDKRFGEQAKRFSQRLWEELAQRFGERFGEPPSPTPPPAQTPPPSGNGSSSSEPPATASEVEEEKLEEVWRTLGRWDREAAEDRGVTVHIRDRYEQKAAAKRRENQFSAAVSLWVREPGLSLLELAEVLAGRRLPPPAPAVEWEDVYAENGDYLGVRRRGETA